MKQAQALIVNCNARGRDAVAAGARISTQEGNVLQIYAKSGDAEKDLKLIRRVAASGHLSVLEHHVMSVAFNDVSVMAEQFIIEFRLASFTVKSRRYVNFSDAGTVIPEGLDTSIIPVYIAAMRDALERYTALQAMGIPREDARFVLPYALRSNFIVTVNLRELINMIGAMLCGRGSRFPELVKLGKQLKEQVEELYPELLDSILLNRSEEASCSFLIAPRTGNPVKADVALMTATPDMEVILREAIGFTGRFDAGDLKALIQDARSRELELLHLTYKVANISLACLTHFSRHRIVSALNPEVWTCVNQGNYVLPPSIEAIPAARELYRSAFSNMTDSLEECLSRGMSACHAAYFAQSGLVTTIVFDVNARELKHFCALRTCERAQWEIQNVAFKMLEAAYPLFPKLFEHYGPSCAVHGRCPEGRMSCGHPVTGFRGLKEKREENNA